MMPPIFEIPGISLRLKRRQWLGAEETPSASSSAANPNIMSISFTGNPKIASPVKLTLDGFATATMADFYLLVANTVSDIKILEAEAATDNTTAGTWSTPADAGKNPRGGNIGRWAAGDTNWQSVRLVPISAVFHKEMAIFATVRQNASAPTWQVKADSYAKSGGAVNFETRPITLDYNGGKPQVVPLGTVSSTVGEHSGINLYFKVDDATGAPTIDFDSIVLLGLDGDANQVVSVLTPPVESGGLSGSYEVIFDHRLLSHPEPVVTFEVVASSLSTPLGYQSPPIIYSKGLGLSAVYLGTYDDQWVHTNTAKSSVSSLNITGTRRLAYLTPE